MPKRISLAMILLSLFLCLLLTACSLDASGSGGNTGVTPTTTTSSPSPTATATPAPSTDYAFVRAHQLWLSMHGAQAVQAANFDKILDPPGNVYYSQPLWFDNDHYLAFTLKVLNYGIGGRICDTLVTYGKEGGLYIVDTSTLQVSLVTAPGDPTSYDANGTPYNGPWEYVFPEDATHLLAWHSTRMLKGETAQGGLYRYDVTSKALSLVLPATALPETVQSEPWYTMHYSSGRLFYEVPTQDTAKQTASFAIYSHQVSQPDTPSVKVMDVGNELFCALINPQPDTQYTRPGWDVSPDGKYLVAQTWSGTDVLHLVGQIQMVTLQGGATTPIFSQVPPAVLQTNVTLRWSPDSQTVLLSQGATANSSTNSLYSTHVTTPNQFVSYQTASSGNYDLTSLSWSANSSAFALYGDTHVYTFTVDQPAGQQLLTDAGYFAWGQQ